MPVPFCIIKIKIKMAVVFWEAQNSTEVMQALANITHKPDKIE